VRSLVVALRGVEHVGPERLQRRAGGQAEVAEAVVAAAGDAQDVLVAAERRVVVVDAGGVDGSGWMKRLLKRSITMT
jgi:hypothetical protein